MVIHKLMLHGEDLSDSSSSPKSITNNGGVTFSSLQSKFGTSSLKFNGSNHLSIAEQGGDFTFGSGDFTIESYINTAGSGTICMKRGTTASGTTWSHWIWISNNKILARVYYNNGSYIEMTSSSNVNTGSWFHIALVRSGTNVFLYVNGTKEATDVTIGNGVVNATSEPYILGVASYGSSLDNYYTGYIDNFRISKGIARWTSNFTPPAQPYSN